MKVPKCLPFPGNGTYIPPGITNIEFKVHILDFFSLLMQLSLSISV